MTRQATVCKQPNALSRHTAVDDKNSCYKPKIKLHTSACTS